MLPEIDYKKDTLPKKSAGKIENTFFLIGGGDGV
jgi:hypothetical protein